MVVGPLNNVLGDLKCGVYLLVLLYSWLHSR
jgi:hypothetical protein